MGTYYTMGPIIKFKASSRENQTEAEWIKTLSQRLDTNLYTLHFEENKVSGEIKENIFKENIHTLYEALIEMSSPRTNPNIRHYQKEYGDELSKQSVEWASLYVKGLNEEQVEVECHFAMMFVEGKVLAEEFSTDPQLINWLFKNSSIDSVLKGCMVSAIVG